MIDPTGAVATGEYGTLAERDAAKAEEDATFVPCSEARAWANDLDAFEAACAAEPTYGALTRLGLAGHQAHDIIQDAAAMGLLPQGVPYSAQSAPAIRLMTADHYRATAFQRYIGGGTYLEERHIGYDALRAPGLSGPDAAAALQRADAYFLGALQIDCETSMAIPRTRVRTP